jgi:DNA-binding MarR family transcriptional regulator
MQEIIKYMEENFGIHAGIWPLKSSEKANLPLYLKGNYNLYHGTLDGLKLIWAKVENNETLTPDQLQKQTRQLRQILHAPVVIVFNKMESWQRKRLIEKQVAFAQPFKQLYVPELMLQFNDVVRDVYRTTSVLEKLTMPAQFAILYHLQVASLEQKQFQEIADLLQYSAMTVTRLVKEIKNAELLSVEGTKEKSISFNLKGKELWQKVLPLLSSPVREVWFTDMHLQGEHFRFGGDTALAAYSMITESKQRTYVIGKDEFRSMKTLGSINKLDDKNGDYRIEVWHYNPVLLSQGNEVDKLSLYLSMQKQEDERVQRALKDLIIELKW